MYNVKSDLTKLSNRRLYHIYKLIVHELTGPNCSEDTLKKAAAVIDELKRRVKK